MGDSLDNAAAGLPHQANDGRRAGGVAAAAGAPAAAPAGIADGLRGGFVYDRLQGEGGGRGELPMDRNGAPPSRALLRIDVTSGGGSNGGSGSGGGGGAVSPTVCLSAW